MGYEGCRFLWSFFPPDVACNLVRPRLDGTVFLFTLLLSLVTGLIFGVVPSLRASKAGILRLQIRRDRSPSSPSMKIWPIAIGLAEMLWANISSFPALPYHARLSEQSKPATTPLSEKPRSPACIFRSFRIREAHSISMCEPVGDPIQVLETVQREVHDIGPRVEVSDVRAGTKLWDQALFTARVELSMLGMFGLLALGLASVGLYGIWPTRLADAVAKSGYGRPWELRVRLFSAWYCGRG